MDIRTIFNAPNREEADRLLKLMVAKYEKIAPQLSEWMETSIPEGLTIFSFKESHRRRIRTTNLPERVNRELKKRTKVASIFPSAESCQRLVTAILEEWGAGKDVKGTCNVKGGRDAGAAYLDTLGNNKLINGYGHGIL